MLSHEENERLTRVTGDAPAGRMLRRYWHPVCWSTDVAEPDGTPFCVRLFGENFVAFRDTHGTVALVDAACPHRRASLALGRNEEGGLRCIYHGWKFDVAGRCVEMPTEPASYNFADRIGIRSYAVRDAGGLIWAYFGPPEHEPAFPAYDWTALPRTHIAHVRYVEHANWLQCAEGTIDTTHSWFLHSGAIADWKLRTSVSMDYSPKLEAEDTPYGFRYAAIRKPNVDPDTMKYVKITLFAFPATGIIARPMDDTLTTLVQIFVPIDDTSTMVFSLMHSFNGKPVDEESIRAYLHLRPGVDLSPDWRPRFCTADGWTQDRVAMKNGSYTGIEGFPNQDIAVQESMGRIVDRSQEHLGTSDIAIIRLRKRMLESLRRFSAGEPPVGLDAAIAYDKLWAEQAVVPIEQPWQSVGPVETHAPRPVTTLQS
jgi:phthalate 4,5-dioxygenase oxygenase subunit